MAYLLRNIFKLRIVINYKEGTYVITNRLHLKFELLTNYYPIYQTYLMA